MRSLAPTPTPVLPPSACGPDIALDAHACPAGPGSHGPVPGQWYWVQPEEDGPSAPWLGCAMKVGTNFVELHSPVTHGVSRVHLDRFWSHLRHEPAALAIIEANARQHQAIVQGLMVQVQALTEGLGLAPSLTALAPAPAGAAAAPGNALAVLCGQSDVKAYASALTRAKETQLPALFEAIKREHQTLALWLKAPTLPLNASLDAMKTSVGGIDDRLLSLGLYAGLVEQAVQCCHGAPAQEGDKLHVMQRMLFCDEESLLDYQTGGMEFSSIGAFDAWLCKPVNRDRILPFSRCLVAMRVRRHQKVRAPSADLLAAFVSMRLDDANKQTFLYVRNGEQVWRIDCEIDFGELIFPDKALYDPAEPKMAQVYGDQVRRMMAVSEYESLCAEHQRQSALYEAWEQANPGEHFFRNPHRGKPEYERSAFVPSEWTPVDRSSVYFDECLATIEGEVKRYNRVALIIQGLFDRSPVLHPHRPVQSWTASGFDQAIVLVGDGTQALHHGEAPDFEAYRRACNASLAVGSIVAGQQDFWLRKEAIKESARLDADWRNKSAHRPTRFKPYGDPGPGAVAQMQAWSARRQEAGFAWQRLSKTDSTREPLNCKLSVPQHELLNLSAYALGDYKRFFVDPRTRAHYLQWAPLLLLAEEYCRGK